MKQIGAVALFGCLALPALCGRGWADEALPEAREGALPAGHGGVLQEVLEGSAAGATKTAGWGKAGRTQDGGGGNQKEFEAE
jgi:hypothetical protein